MDVCTFETEHCVNGVCKRTHRFSITKEVFDKYCMLAPVRNESGKIIKDYEEYIKYATEEDIKGLYMAIMSSPVKSFVYNKELYDIDVLEEYSDYLDRYEGCMTIQLDIFYFCMYVPKHSKNN